MFFTCHGRPWSNPIIACLLIDILVWQHLYIETATRCVFICKMFNVSSFGWQCNPTTQPSFFLENCRNKDPVLPSRHRHVFSTTTLTYSCTSSGNSSRVFMPFFTIYFIGIAHEVHCYNLNSFTKQLSIFTSFCGYLIYHKMRKVSQYTW